MKIAVWDGECYAVGEKVVMEETLGFSLVAVRAKLKKILKAEPESEIVKIKDGRYGIAF